MKRTLVVGDIHGALKALKQVFDKARLTSDDQLIFLGDYVDGWSESAQTVQYLMDLSKTQSCIFIKGNHDEWCEQWLRTGEGDSEWLIHGGQSTVKSYEAFNKMQQDNHLKFLESMKLYEIDAENRLFIHAGFTSMHGPQKEFHLSNMKWDRTLWEMALSMDNTIDRTSILYPKRLKLFNEIFIGHTPTINFGMMEPMHAMNVWNLDTGAAFTGKLSIMDLDTKEFWQSDVVKELYPGEIGRNFK